jgi:chloramphenicol-sensitive protein RarD
MTDGDGSSRATQLGVLYGLAAYGLWGVFPLFFAVLLKTGAGPLEILAHRVLWSCVLLVLLVTLQQRWRDLARALANRRVLITLGISTLLIGLNWLTFLYAIARQEVMQASLGYFLTPLMNVILGVTVLGERLRIAQVASVLLALIAVSILTISGGSLPWIALILSTSFAFYGLCRKTVAVDSMLGLAVETMLLAPVALSAIVWWQVTETSTASGLFTYSLFAASGVATATPLLLFASSARRLRMVTVGFLQYLAPTLQFLIAVFVFSEPFSQTKALAFGLIWGAIAVYSVDSLWSLRKSNVVSLDEPTVTPPLPLKTDTCGT